MMHPQYRSDLLRMADILKVLGDPNRLHILSLISHQELCVCEITSILNISQSNASQHLARLRSVDLVKERRNAQWIYYSLNRDAGNINEAGTSDALEWRGCQQYPECGICVDGETCILVYFNIRN